VLYIYYIMEWSYRVYILYFILILQLYSFML
jgi:hypothetical protein